MIKKSFDKLLDKYVSDEELKPYYYKISISLLTFFVSLLSFISLYLLLYFNFLNEFDEQVSSAFVPLRSPFGTKIMKFVSEVGDTFGYLFIIILTSMILFFKKVWKLAIQGILILIIASGLNILLKGLVARPRPFDDPLVYASFYSFPSGHAMSAMVFYGFLIHIVFSLEIKSWLKYVFTLIFVCFSFVIGLSRIYLGVHYASDILGGYFAGLIWLMFCLTIIYSLKIRALNTNK